jgi:hypothetical protein
MDAGWCVITAYLSIAVVVILGWVLNIIALVGCDFDPFGKEEILRIIGVPIAILGSIFGYIDL